MGNIFFCFKLTKEVKRPLIPNSNYKKQQHGLKSNPFVFKLTKPDSPQDFNSGVLRDNQITVTRFGIQFDNNSCYFDCIMMMLFGCANDRFLHLLQGQPEGSLGHMILTLVVEPLQRVGYVPSTAYRQIRQKIAELTRNYEFLYQLMDLSDLLIALEDHIPSWKMCAYTSSTGICLPPQSIIVGGIENLPPQSIIVGEIENFSPSEYLKTLKFSSSTSGFFVEVSGSSNIEMSYSVVIDDKSSKKFNLTGFLSRNLSPHFTCMIYNHLKGRWIFFDDNGTSDERGCVPIVIELPSSFQSYLDGGCVDDSLVQTIDEKGVKITDRMEECVFAFYS